MVGAWPCGTVTVIGELYGSESKPQVYGIVHTFLNKTMDSTKTLSKYACINLLFSYIASYVTGFAKILLLNTQQQDTLLTIIW